MGLLEDLLLALLTLVVGYGVGLRQAEQQRIIEERAKVLSDLFKRYVDLEEQVYLLVQIIDLPGKPNREEKYRRAAESVNNLLAYHRRNTRYGCRARPLVTLTPSSKGTECTSSPSAFSGVEEVGRPETAEEWLNVFNRFQKESPNLRDALEEEFRAALGNYRAKLWIRRRRQRNSLEHPQEPVIKSPQSHENRQ